jgi:hypothetical protein
MTLTQISVMLDIHLQNSGLSRTKDRDKLPRPVDYVRVGFVCLLSWLYGLFIFFVIAFEGPDLLVGMGFGTYVLILLLLAKYSPAWKRKWAYYRVPLVKRHISPYALSSGVGLVLIAIMTTVLAASLPTSAAWVWVYFLVFAPMGLFPAALVRKQIYTFPEAFRAMLRISLVAFTLIIIVVPIMTALTSGPWQVVASIRLHMLLIGLFLLLLAVLGSAAFMIQRESNRIASEASEYDHLITAVLTIRGVKSVLVKTGKWEQIKNDIRSRYSGPESCRRYVKLVAQQCIPWLAGTIGITFVISTLVSFFFFVVLFTFLYSDQVLATWLRDLQPYLVAPQNLARIGLPITLETAVRIKMALFYSIISAIFIVANIATNPSHRKEFTRLVEERANSWMAAMVVKHACWYVQFQQHKSEVLLIESEVTKPWTLN